jgi:hypothetical protein
MKIVTWYTILILLSNCGSANTYQKDPADHYVSNLEAAIDELIHGNSINTERAAAEFCECQDSDSPTKCYDAWVEKYKDTSASNAASQKLGETMAECDLEGILYISTKIMDR